MNRRAVWAQIARELGGHHRVQGWFDDERLEVEQHGVPIVVDLYELELYDPAWRRRTKHTFTRVAAAHRFGPGPRLRIYREGFVPTTSKATGIEDLDLGDPALARLFVIEGDDAALARRLWSPAATAVMSNRLLDCRFASTRERVEVVGPGAWELTTQILAAIELVGMLASIDLYGVAALRVLGGTFEHPRGERPRVVLDAGVRVVIASESIAGRLVTTARTDDRAPAAPFELDVTDGKLGDPAFPLPQGAYPHLARVGSGTLARGAFVWRDLELDADRLRAGASLLAAIAAGGDGIYR